MIAKLMKLLVQWAGRMAGIEETRNTYNVFLRKHREKSSLGRLRRQDEPYGDRL